TFAFTPPRSRTTRSTGSRAAACTSPRPSYAPPRRSRRRPRRPQRVRRAPVRRRSRACGGTARPPVPVDRGCPPSAGRARLPSPQHDLRVGKIVVELDASEPFECFGITRARSRDDMLRELRPGIVLVPAQRLAVIADELLVERRLRPAGRVFADRRQARGGGGEGLGA